MYGHYFRNLDNKSRVIIPSEFRKELGKKFYITLGPDKVLEIRDEKSFKLFTEKLLGNNMLNPNARKFARVMLGNSAELSADSQGRVHIPQELLKAALITKKELAIVGVGNKLEVWSKPEYDKFNKSLEGQGSIDELAKKLLKDGAEL